MSRVYISLGSNLGNSHAILKTAFRELEEQFLDLQFSKIYVTTPVSTIEQRDFLNAAASFDTDLSLENCFAELEKIERKLGKIPKAKDQPRKIDIDLLFFKDKFLNTPFLQVPHRDWQNRLFVLKPLSDLTDEILTPEGVVNIPDMLNSFKNPYNETVVPYEQNQESPC